MNYTIITDEIKLKKFIKWLPELLPNEKYYLALFSRKKYIKDINIKHTADKLQLKRFTSDKTKLFNKIKQLEVPYETYILGEIIIPQESLALYITINPRDMYKATINTMVKLAESIRDSNVIMNPHQEALSEIHKSKGRTCYLDFDIDEQNEEVLLELITQIKTYVNEDAVTWLRTRGGLHVLVDPSKVTHEYKREFYQGISNISQVDQKGDLLIPVPGTFQGGFTPCFVDY
jgi:uncharacterized protein (UPF0305 family)